MENVKVSLIIDSENTLSINLKTGCMQAIGYSAHKLYHSVNKVARTLNNDSIKAFRLLQECLEKAGKVQNVLTEYDNK